MTIVRAADRRSGDGVDQPLDRALAVLEFVLTQRGPVSAAAVAEATQLPAATAHRLIGQLEARSLLKRALGSKKLLPGRRLVELGTRIVTAALVADGTHLLLERLAAKLDEHCHLGIISHQEVLYIDSARTVRPSRLLFEPGRRAPIYCTSIGKVFLSTLSEPDLDRLVRRIDFKVYTPTTISSSKALIEDIGRVRRRGWASTDGEFTPGVVGCAVPLRNGGMFVAGLGVSVPTAHCSYDEIEKFIPDLIACAAAIERHLNDGT